MDCGIKNMILYFENSIGVRREIGKSEKEEDIYPIITEFLKARNYTSYYTRYWTNPDNNTERYYDVGSWSERFIAYNEKGW